MAKDNQSKRSDPGTANDSQSKPGYKELPRKKWAKRHYAEFLYDHGVERAHQMTIRELRKHLSTLKEQGEIKDGRVNSGPKRVNIVELQEQAIEIISNHAMTEVDILVKDVKTGKETTEKVTRVEALMIQLFQQGKKGNVQAINSYLDRFVGKPKQTLEHSGSIKTEEQNEPTQAEKAAAEAYEKAIASGSVPSPVTL